MRQMVERLRQRLAAFVGQREDLMLAVRCSDADCGLVVKILEGLDESSTSELYWTVVDPFDNAATFVEACVRAFSVRHEAVRLALQQRNLPPWPPLPPGVANRVNLDPVVRLRELIVFSRSLLPELNGCGVVWGLLPMPINDPEGYVELMAALWRHEFPFPWCHHVRMVVRDDFAAPHLGRLVGASPRVAEYTADFSPEAIRQGLEEEAGEEGAQLPDRVNSCLMLAGIDYSHGRYDRAIQQYEVVHQYAAATQNPTLATIAISGLGSVLRSQGKADEAAELLQHALAPASLASPPPVPVLFDLYLKLGEIRHSQQRWAEAEVFLEGAADFAYLLRDPDQRLRCLRLLGEAQYQQAKIQPALKTWYAGAVVAGKLDKRADQEHFTAYLRDHFTTTGQEQGFARVAERIQREVAAHEADSTA